MSFVSFLHVAVVIVVATMRLIVLGAGTGGQEAREGLDGSAGSTYGTYSSECGNTVQCTGCGSSTVFPSAGACVSSGSMYMSLSCNNSAGLSCAYATTFQDNQCTENPSPVSYTCGVCIPPQLGLANGYKAICDAANPQQGLTLLTCTDAACNHCTVGGTFVQPGLCSSGAVSQSPPGYLALNSVGLCSQAVVSLWTGSGCVGDPALVVAQQQGACIGGAVMTCEGYPTAAPLASVEIVTTTTTSTTVPSTTTSTTTSTLAPSTTTTTTPPPLVPTTTRGGNSTTISSAASIVASTTATTTTRSTSSPAVSSSTSVAPSAAASSTSSKVATTSAIAPPPPSETQTTSSITSLPPSSAPPMSTLPNLASFAVFQAVNSSAHFDLSALSNSIATLTEACLMNVTATLPNVPSAGFTTVSFTLVLGMSVNQYTPAFQAEQDLVQLIAANATYAAQAFGIQSVAVVYLPPALTTTTIPSTSTAAPGGANSKYPPGTFVVGDFSPMTSIGIVVSCSFIALVIVVAILYNAGICVKRQTLTDDDRIALMRYERMRDLGDSDAHSGYRMGTVHEGTPSEASGLPDDA